MNKMKEGIGIHQKNQPKKKRKQTKGKPQGKYELISLAKHLRLEVKKAMRKYQIQDIILKHSVSVEVFKETVSLCMHCLPLEPYDKEYLSGPKRDFLGDIDIYCGFVW